MITWHKDTDKTAQNKKNNKWTQSVIRNGYRIQFRVRPKLTRVVPQFLRVTPSDPEKIQLLQTEVESMLDKHAVEPVSSCHTKGGYYSRLFLVRKKSGGWSNRSVPTKSACNHSSFQDGNFGLGSSFFTEARLGHFPQLDRCIFSHTNSSQVKEVSLFSLHGENIPVSSLAIRPGSSFLRVLQNCEGSGQTLSSHGHVSTFLSR